jgi:hypothetical protein
MIDWVKTGNAMVVQKVNHTPKQRYRNFFNRTKSGTGFVLAGSRGFSSDRPRKILPDNREIPWRERKTIKRAIHSPEINVAVRK